MASTMRKLYKMWRRFVPVRCKGTYLVLTCVGTFLVLSLLSGRETQEHQSRSRLGSTRLTDLQTYMARTLFIDPEIKYGYRVNILPRAHERDKHDSDAASRAREHTLVLPVRNDMGIGNQMFIYAAGYGLARTLSLGAMMIIPTPVLVNTFELMGENSELVELSTIAMNRKVQFVSSTKCCKYDATMVDGLSRALSSATDLSEVEVPLFLTNGLLQSWRYFHDYAAEIRSRFQFRPHIHEAAEQELRYIMTNKNPNHRYIFVAAHLRHGANARVKKPEADANIAYLNRAIKFMVEKFSDVVVQFLLFTDDYEWLTANEHRLESTDVWIQPPSSAERDLCLMTLCNHTIVSTGTFGWWAAYLTNGITVAQKHRSTNVKYLNEFDIDDFLLPSWIRL